MLNVQLAFRSSDLICWVPKCARQSMGKPINFGIRLVELQNFLNEFQKDSMTQVGNVKLLTHTLAVRASALLYGTCIWDQTN